MYHSCESILIFFDIVELSKIEAKLNIGIMSFASVLVFFFWLETLLADMTLKLQ